MNNEAAISESVPPQPKNFLGLRSFYLFLILIIVLVLGGLYVFAKLMLVNKEPTPTFVPTVSKSSILSQEDTLRNNLQGLSISDELAQEIKNDKNLASIHDPDIKVPDYANLGTEETKDAFRNFLIAHLDKAIADQGNEQIDLANVVASVLYIPASLATLCDSSSYTDSIREQGRGIISVSKTVALGVASHTRYATGLELEKYISDFFQREEVNKCL